MTAHSEWHHVTRIVWMSGGVVAVNNPGPEVQIGAGLGGRLIGSRRIPSYPNLFTMLSQQGFPIVGATFIESVAEVQGLRPPQFRMLSVGKGWLAWDIHQQWREIAHASGKHDNMPLMDVASRIASGMAYSDMRLHDLVDAYSIQLRGRLHENDAVDHQRFKDTNSFTVYKAIHALFWEMAVLRDVLAEFAAKFCFRRSGVTTLRGLISSLDKNPSDDPLARQFVEAADKATGGWLAIFTEYRNLFTHSAPMEQAEGVAFAILDTRVISPDLLIPQIYYPLPSNVAELTRRRSSGPLYATLKQLLDASSGRRPERSTEPDALDYLHSCLDQLAQLSLVLASHSPIHAQPIHIGPEDIIGEIRISRGS
mgnify:CR=1 FL=1